VRTGGSHAGLRSKLAGAPGIAPRLLARTLGPDGDRLHSAEHGTFTGPGKAPQGV